MNRESLIDLYNMSHPMKFVGDYALRLRFKFGFAKKVISGKSFSRESIWYLNSYHLENVNSLEILGVAFEDCPDWIYGQANRKT